LVPCLSQLLEFVNWKIQKGCIYYFGERRREDRGCFSIIIVENPQKRKCTHSKIDWSITGKPGYLFDIL